MYYELLISCYIMLLFHSQWKRNFLYGRHRLDSTVGPDAAVLNVLCKAHTSALLNKDRCVEIPQNPISGWPARGITCNSGLLLGLSQMSQHSIQKCPTASGASRDPETRSVHRDTGKNAVCLCGMFIGAIVRNEMRLCITVVQKPVQSPAYCKQTKPLFPSTQLGDCLSLWLRQISRSNWEWIMSYIWPKAFLSGTLQTVRSSKIFAF